MKKVTFTLCALLATVSICLVSCSKKSSSGSSDSVDKKDTIEKKDTELSKKSADLKMETSRDNSQDVDRFILMMDAITNQIVANPQNIDQIVSRFQSMGGELDENTPLTASDIRKLNNAVDNFFSKLILAALKMHGASYDDLDYEEQEQLNQVFVNISNEIETSTINARTLGEYGKIVGNVMNNLN